MTAPALVLYGHGARDPEWARPFYRLRDRLLARRPGTRVEIAFLEFMSPPLDEVMARLAGDAVTEVRVVPVFISQGGHVKDDVNRLVDEVRRQWPKMRIEQLTALGEVDAVLDAIVDYALAGS